MNLNNWLCKHFDKGEDIYDRKGNIIAHNDKKGYVTIFDVVFGVVLYPAWCACILLVLFSLIGVVFAAIIRAPGLNEPPTWKNFFIDVVFAGYIGIIPSYGQAMSAFKIGGYIIVLAIGILCLIYISEIKIAKCPLKEDDK